MRASDRLKRRLAGLKRDLKGAAQATANPSGLRRVRTVNTAGRTNIVLAANVGEPGATQGASSTQHVRIRQRNGETVEETETIETRLES